MAIEVGDIIRLAVQWLADGTDQIVNVHTFEVVDLGAASGDLAVMQDIADAALPALYDEVLNEIADNIVGTLLTGINLSKSEVLPPVSHNMDGLATGTDALARQVTALVYLNTNVPRRQGRSYLPPFVENGLTDSGIWNTGVQTALAAYCVRLLAAVDGDEVSILRNVGSSILGGFSSPSFAGYSASPRTQRRRTPGRGA